MGAAALAMQPAVRLVSGPDSIIVTGAAAEIVALVATAQHVINEQGQGALRVDFAPDGAALRWLDAVIARRVRGMAATRPCP